MTKNGKSASIYRNLVVWTLYLLQFRIWKIGKIQLIFLTAFCNGLLHFVFRCLINCGSKVIPSVKLSIESTCEGSQCLDISSYHWILYQGDKSNPIVWKQSNDLHLMTSTLPNSSRIVIKENSLNSGINYRLAVLVSNGDGFTGISVYDFSTSLPPTGGKCTIEPSSGIALITYFSLSCSGWASSNIPLSYQFQLQLYNGLTSLVYHGLNTSVESLLPSTGDLSQNFTLKLNVTVTDGNGASATYANLSVQVGLIVPITKSFRRLSNIK